MQDIVYVAVVIAFFVIAVLFTLGCDRIIGPDADALAEGARDVADPKQESKEVAA
jgi:hypothetical protein